jgi:hypothetical protein
MLTTKFLMTRDIAGYNGFGLIPTTVKSGVQLAANTAQTLLTVPSDYANYIVIFSFQPGSNVFVDFNQTASAFTGVAGSVTSELLPQARSVRAGTVISAITPDVGGAYVQALCYVAPPYTN